MHEPPLTQRSATALARAIREGEVSSREVVEAHIEMCRHYQPHTGAIAVAMELERVFGGWVPPSA